MQRGTGTVGKNNCASNLLVSVTGVNAETNVNFDGLVKLSLSSLASEVKSFIAFVELVSVNKLCAFNIFLTVFHYLFSSYQWSIGNILPLYSSLTQSTTSTPMERAVPAIMLIALSMLAALRSGIFVSAIFLICSLVILPTLVLLGTPEPL